ncbi:MAG: hypothetical protein FWC80_02455 [Firmicutes bacterium]|nr:hypothetical protein [Bacillota bacterium]
MNITLHFAAEFETCYLANGLFAESAEKISYPKDEAMYITVLPLSAIHLPYTVKLIGGFAVTNKNLCKTFVLPRGNYVVKLLPRFNYVYSPNNDVGHSIETNLVSRFFAFVKSKDWNNARQMMTQDLGSSLTDDSLMNFFEEYTEIVENKYLPGENNVHFLADENSNCTPYKFSLENGLIDNIQEVDV